MEWKRGHMIGRGAFATVSIATASATGEIFAVKSVELSHSSFLQREKEILSQLSSPYIVQYRGEQITYENNTPFHNLFMEYVPGGTISESIKKNGGSIDESSIRIFTHHILLALNYLHNNGIVHCDIKGQNILIGKKGIKIADLGCAKRVGTTSAFSGTPAFMAPEVARGEEQSFPADVWALGCMVIEMGTGSPPFPGEQNPVSVLYRVGFCDDVPEIPESISVQAKDFVNKCLERDSKKRLNAKELLEHPFFDNLRLNSPKFDEYSWVSPTSVLDQGFWDSVEVPASSPNSIHPSFGPNSPAERIWGLINSSNLDISNWDCEENWISVRTEENEETAGSVGRFVFDSLDALEVNSDDVAVFLYRFSVLTDTLIPCENVLDDTISIILVSKKEFTTILFSFIYYFQMRISLFRNSKLLEWLPLIFCQGYSQLSIVEY